MSLTKQNIFLIGGTGRMGNWLINFLQSQKIEVYSAGRSFASNTQLADADIIFISVPITYAAAVIQSLKEKIKPTALVVDLTSIKSSTLDALITLGNPSLGMHFLFGPTVSSIQNQKIIINRIKNGANTCPLLKVFKDAGGELIEMTGPEHDRTMAYIQSLTHFINIALMETLLNAKIDITGHVATPVFIAQTAAMLRIINQDKELLSSIQIHNPSNSDALLQFSKAIQNLQVLVNKKDQSEISNHILSLQKRVKPNGKKSIKKMGKKSPKHLITEGKVAFLGPIGTYSYQAATSISSKGVSLVPYKTLYDVFEAIKIGKIDAGVVPAENTTEGTIRETLDYLVDFDLRTNSSTIVDVHHCLLSNEDSLDKVTKVISHPQALAQCRKWLRKNIPQAEIEGGASTLAAVKDTTLRSGVAVLAPKIAAKKYGLTILARNIEDNHENITKFYVISKQIDSLQVESEKTLLFLTIFNRIGVLKDMLEVFSNFKINLSKLESRPSREKAWDYHFFIEADIPPDDLRLQQALDMMKQYCPVIKILGGI